GGPAIGEETIDDGARIAGIIGGYRDLHAIACGENHGFGYALAGSQVGQSGRKRIFPERESLPHLNGCGFVTHAGDQELHCFNMAPRCACAGQTSAESPSTASVIMAALRPRHPAVVRRNTSAM